MPNRATAACAEFPNDNPALHGGAIWWCPDTTGAAVWRAPHPQRAAESTATRTAPEAHTSASPAAVEPAPSKAAEAETIHEQEDPEIEIVDELTFHDAVDEPPSMSAMLEDAVERSDEPPRAQADKNAAEDPFTHLVCVLEDVARAFDRGDDAPLCIRALLGESRLDDRLFGGRASEALIAGGLVVPTAGGLARTDRFAAKLLAWQRVLRGESEDFEACGNEALDEWAADVVARALSTPPRAEGVRRELRQRGVAAFGLVADAA